MECSREAVSGSVPDRFVAGSCGQSRKAAKPVVCLQEQLQLPGDLEGPETFGFHAHALTYCTRG